MKTLNQSKLSMPNICLFPTQSLWVWIWSSRKFPLSYLDIYPCGVQSSVMSCPASISLHVAGHCLRSQCPTLTLYTRHSFPPSCSKLQVLLRMEFYYENWCRESAGSQCQEVDKTCYWDSSFIEPLDSLKDLKLIHILLSTLSHIRSGMSQQTLSSP